ncbi:putative GMC-type oxidoreductase [Streptomyces antimycoticus]
MGYHQVTQRNGLRCSSAIAFLEPAAGRPNLTGLPSTTALCLSLDGSRAAGLEVDHLGTVRTIHVDREVVLSLGAYNSPHLLLQSGVGPADELTAGGITPLHDLPDVGRNMQDHTGCFISFFSDTEPLLGPESPRRSGSFASRPPARWPGTRPAASSAPATTSPPRTSRSTQRSASSVTRVSPRRSNRECRFGPYVARPWRCRGSVRLRHSHPYAKPRIFHNYLDDPDDRPRLREGVRLCMRIAREQRLTSLLQSDLRGAADAGLAPRSDSDQDIDEFIRTQSFSFYHPSGTCMMGKVVDHELRVRGLENVRVADTSIMPTLVTGNTNAPAIMIGEMSRLVHPDVGGLMPGARGHTVRTTVPPASSAVTSSAAAVVSVTRVCRRAAGPTWA